MPTDPAAKVARRLAAYFLEHGNFVVSGPTSAQAIGMNADDFTAEGQQYAADLAFSGLAVQSVGYEVGSETSTVHVYVTKGSKGAEKVLETDDDEVVVRVSRVGRVTVKPELAGAATNQGRIFLRKQRIACGTSCAPSSEPCTGTIGALVKVGKKSALYMMSNNHVFAGCNHVPIGMPILSPSPADAGPNRPAPQAVSEHAAIEALRSGVPALVAPVTEDVALARVIDNDIVSSWQGDPVDGYDTPTATMDPVTGLKVKKFGRTTGLTTGVVEAYVSAPEPIPYRSKHFTATVWFRKVWTVKADSGTLFALPGDSGSLVVSEDGGAAIGLLFAASPNGEYGFMFPMTHIVGLFGGLTLVGGHGV